MLVQPHEPRLATLSLERLAASQPKHKMDRALLGRVGLRLKASARARVGTVLGGRALLRPLTPTPTLTLTLTLTPTLTLTTAGA